MPPIQLWLVGRWAESPPFLLSVTMPQQWLFWKNRALLDMSTENVIAEVSQLISPDLKGMGYDLVRVKFVGGKDQAGLQIMAERFDGRPMTVEDCAQLSEKISSKLDDTNNLRERYSLEVSSPGIDRPLVRLKDFSRFAGHLAQIELKESQGGQRRFKGFIGKVSDSSDALIEFKTDDGSKSITLNDISQAKLILTDALIKASTASNQPSQQS